MPRKRTPRAGRKSRGSFSEEHATPPTGEEANAKWREFMARLDELNQNVCLLADMGETITQALHQAAAETGNPLLGLLGRVRQMFSEARQEYGQQEGDGR